MFQGTPEELIKADTLTGQYLRGEVKSQKSKVESQGSIVESQKSKVESQESKVESQKSKVESQKSKVESIKVYVGDELACVAEPLTIDGETYYFLTVQSDLAGKALRFESDGEVLMPADGAIQYAADAHAGSLTAPIVLTPTGETGVYKLFENNHIVIIRNNEKYDVTGKKLQ